VEVVATGVAGHAYFGHCHADHGIPSDDLDQLIFGPAVGAFWSQRQDHEAMFLVGVPNTNRFIEQDKVPQLSPSDRSVAPASAC